MMMEKEEWRQAIAYAVSALGVSAAVTISCLRCSLNKIKIER